MPGRVFIVQKHVKYNKRTGDLTPKFDMSSAEAYGEFVYLLSPLAQPTDPVETIAKLRKTLAGFCDDDVLLLVGNPCFIGLATAIASDINEGRVRLLQWSGKHRRYHEVTCYDLIEWV
jgi:hypothetical protein